MKAHHLDDVVVAEATVHFHIEIVHLVERNKTIVGNAFAQIDASLADSVGLQGQVQQLKIAACHPIGS